MNKINSHIDPDEEEKVKDSEIKKEEKPPDPNLFNKDDVLEFSNKAKKKDVSNNLDDYGINLNEFVKSGVTDGFTGREDIIQKTIEVLSNRDAPNPILIGNPGTGKTAIVQYIAKLINDKEVPECLLDHTIYSIDINGLVAGTMYRGQLEQKLDAIITAASKNRKTIIFFDEIHMLAYAGDSEGSHGTLINALKAPLLSGMFKMIGATTLEEYNSAFSKANPFQRRTRIINVSDLEKNQILKIIESKIPSYEEFHKVKFKRENINLIYDLAEKYITDRYFPDKALTVLDNILTKEKISNFCKKTPYKEITKEIKQLKLEKDELVRKEEFDKAVELRNRIIYLEYELKNNALYKKEDDTNLVSKTDTVFHSVRDLSNNDIVDPSISMKERFINLESTLNKYIIGQNNAVQKVTTLMQNARFGFPDKNKPFATMLFLGTTGTGKTLLAKKLAQSLFGSKNFYKFDMSEYDNEASASKLIGANPGFIGYNESPMLQVAVKTNPFSIFLFDEIEKAHPKILDLFLQILDEGKIKTNNGVDLNFTNSVIIMTSNIGSSQIRNTSQISLDPTTRDTSSTIQTRIKAELYKYLRPEFINRFDEIITFEQIKKNDRLAITNLEISYIQEISDTRNIKFSVTEKALNQLSDESFSEEFGARNIRRHVQKTINNVIARYIIESNKENNLNLEIDYTNNKFFAKEI